MRAAHVREDRPPWLFEESLAEALLRPREIAELEAAMSTWPPEVRAGFRASHAVRARLAEDVVVEGLAAGRRDYVLLGAGLDTFAWRHPRATEFLVCELDHPDTQAWKRRALRRVGLAEPSNVRFVPIDLTTAALEDIETPPRATWNWLGVTMYLEPPATERTLRAVAANEPGTTLVVNFLLPPDELDGLAVATRSASSAAVAAAHEPVLASYSTGQVGELLHDTGFGDVQLLDADALGARYLTGRSDLQLPRSTVIAVATV